MAWIFWKTQQKLYDETLKQQLLYYQELESECLRIRQNIAGCSDNSSKDDKPADSPFHGFIPVQAGNKDAPSDKAFLNTLFPQVTSKFDSGMFQQDILGKFDNETPILVEESLHVKVFFNKTKYILSLFNDKLLQAHLFNSLFLEPGINPVALYQVLYEKVILYKVDQEKSDVYFDGIRREFCAILTKELEARVSIENAENIQELIFGSAPSDTGHNFASNHNKISVNKLIQSRFYPSVLLKNSNPYTQTSYIIPEDSVYGDNEWARVFGNSLRPDHVIHRKSLVSIMQTFSLNGLSDIFDEVTENPQNQQ